MSFVLPNDSTNPPALDLLSNASIEVISPEIPLNDEIPSILERSVAALRSGKTPFLPSIVGIDADEERTLKQEALSKGLLVLGPGASMSLVGDHSLGIVCEVARGEGVGVVGTDGDALREFTALAFDHYGATISHALAVGCRDLSNRVGGLMAEATLQALADDPKTKSICLVAHRPSDDVRAHFSEVLAKLGKPAVVRWLGDFWGNTSGENTSGAWANDVFEAADIDEAAQAAAKLSRGEALEFRKQCAKCVTCMRAAKLVGGKAVPHRFTWIFGNSALAHEALGFLRHRRVQVATPLIPLSSTGPVELSGNLIVDSSLGLNLTDSSDDLLARQAALVQKCVAAPSVGAVLFDLSLGKGAHPDPAQVFIDAVQRGLSERSKAATGREFSEVIAVATITGTALDAQNFAAQKAALKNAGIAVAPTSAKAARIVSELFDGPSESRGANSSVESVASKE